MKDHNEMTLGECRDEIALLQGWRFDPTAISHIDSITMSDVLGVWSRGDTILANPNNHPIEPTLDDAAAAMPKGWTVTIVQTPFIWQVSTPAGLYSKADTELLARMRLAVACLRADRKEQP